MKNKVINLAIAFVIIVAAFALGSPASASVPDWDARLTHHTAAEWASISTVLDRPQDKAYFGNLPASPAAKMKKDAGDCPSPTVTGQGILCLWNGYSYGGTIWKLPRAWLHNGYPSNGLSFTGSGIDNTSKGWWNRTTQYIRLYDNSTCADFGFIRDMGDEVFAVQDTAADADWENRFSSASLYVDHNQACTNNPAV